MKKVLILFILYNFLLPVSYSRTGRIWLNPLPQGNNKFWKLFGNKKDGLYKIVLNQFKPKQT